MSIPFSKMSKKGTIEKKKYFFFVIILTPLACIINLLRGTLRVERPIIRHIKKAKSRRDIIVSIKEYLLIGFLKKTREGVK